MANPPKADGKAATSRRTPKEETTDGHFDYAQCRLRAPLQYGNDGTREGTPHICNSEKQSQLFSGFEYLDWLEG